MSFDYLLYRRKSGSKVRITLDFVDQLFTGAAQELKSPSTQHFIHRTRIPNERELYGLLVKAVLQVGGEEDIGHVATEVQVDRLDKASTTGAKSTGRVDLLVTYRNTVFLIEAKVVRVSLDRSTSNGIAESKAIRDWDSATRQLRAIDSTRVESLLEQDVKKLALIICLYYDGRQNGREDGWADLIADRHRAICDQIDETSSQISDYEWKSTLNDPIHPYRRRSSSVDDGRRLTLYGFSLLGATVE